MSRKKIILLGEIGVGKTSLIRRFVFDQFETSYKGTIGFNIYTTAIVGVGAGRDETLEFLIWDTDGDDAQRILRRKATTHGTAGVIVVADLVRPRTIATMASLASTCITELPGRHVHLILNKSDLSPASATGAIEKHTALDHLHLPLLTASAKSGDNVESAFRAVADAILRRGL